MTQSVRVWLDDRDISSFTQRIKLDLDAEAPDAVAVTLTIFLDRVEIDAQTLINWVVNTKDAPTIETAIRALKKAKAELPEEGLL